MIQSVTRYPSPATRHPLPATRHPLPVTRYPQKSAAEFSPLSSPWNFLFLANLLWRGVAVNKKRAKVQPRFRSFLQALSSEKTLNVDPRQKQLKLEEIDNAIIKSIPSSFWQNFLLFLLQMVVEQEADKFFSQIFYCRTFSGKSNHGHFLKHYLLNYNFA